MTEFVPQNRETRRGSKDSDAPGGFKVILRRDAQCFAASVFSQHLFRDSNHSAGQTRCYLTMTQTID